MKIYKYRKMFIITMLLIVGVVSFSSYNEKSNRKVWYENNRLIAHALGGINNNTYTNSHEAMKYNLSQNFVLFEADLCSTSDNVQVLRHDWNSTFEDATLEKGIAPTLEEFLSTSIYNSYSPMSLWDLFDYMEENPEIWIITDSKNTEYEEVVNQFQQIIIMARERHQEKLLNRFIIQIYNDEMLDAVKSVYPFENFIYTCYVRGTSNMDDLIAFCTKNNIPVITVPVWNWNNDHPAREALQNSDRKVFVHTINDTSEMKTYLEQGVWGFYTDFITPETFSALLK